MSGTKVTPSKPRLALVLVAGVQLGEVGREVPLVGRDERGARWVGSNRRTSSARSCWSALLRSVVTYSAPSGADREALGVGLVRRDRPPGKKICLPAPQPLAVSGTHRPPCFTRRNTQLLFLTAYSTFGLRRVEDEAADVAALGPGRGLPGALPVRDGDGCAARPRGRRERGRRGGYRCRTGASGWQGRVGPPGTAPGRSTGVWHAVAFEAPKLLVVDGDERAGAVGAARERAGAEVVASHRRRPARRVGRPSRRACRRCRSGRRAGRSSRRRRRCPGPWWTRGRRSRAPGRPSSRVPSGSFAEKAVAAVARPLSICSQPAMLTSVAPPLYSSIASPTGVAPLSDETSLMRTWVQRWPAGGVAGANRLPPGEPMSPVPTRATLDVTDGRELPLRRVVGAERGPAGGYAGDALRARTLDGACALVVVGEAVGEVATASGPLKMLISSARPRLVVLPARIFTPAPRPQSLRNVASADSVMIADSPTASVPRPSSGTVPRRLAVVVERPAGEAHRDSAEVRDLEVLTRGSTGSYIHSVIRTFGGARPRVLRRGGRRRGRSRWPERRRARRRARCQVSRCRSPGDAQIRTKTARPGSEGTPRSLVGGA